MSTLLIDIELENPLHPGVRRTLGNVLVDTGAELSWIPGDVMESLGVERVKLARFRKATG